MSPPVYLLKLNLVLSLAWFVYHLVLRKLTFFHWNRVFLLACLVLSFILPWFELQVFRSEPGAGIYSGIDWSHVDHLGTDPGVNSSLVAPAASSRILLVPYLLVSLFFLARSFYRLARIFQQTRRSRRIRKGPVSIYVLQDPLGSFTLFRNIYLDPRILDQGIKPVLKHELLHARQLHSLDILLMEIMVAILWFNPIAYLLRRAVRDNHEYLADLPARTSQHSLLEYLICLRIEVSRHSGISPASAFHCSTLKKRITMLTKKTSSRYSMLRYLVFLPFIASCLILLDSPSSQAARLNTTSFFIKEGAPSRFPLPEAFRNKITWGFQEKGIHPFSKEVRTHLGIDIAAPIGTPVFATADGVVLQAAEFEDWGKLIVLEHADGFQSYYAHLDEISVEEGKRVKAGMVIGKVGITGQSTGPHLHYEVHRHGEHLNPADYY